MKLNWIDDYPVLKWYDYDNPLKIEDKCDCGESLYKLWIRQIWENDTENTFSKVICKNCDNMFIFYEGPKIKEMIGD